MKQADVVLLGYPVPFSLSPPVRRKNLEMYEAVTSPQGPAMTWVRGSGSHGSPSPAPWPALPPMPWTSPQRALRPLTPEHVCRGLDGAEGRQAGTGPAGQELRQHHRALQGQPGPRLPVPWPHPLRGPGGGSGSPASGVAALAMPNRPPRSRDSGLGGPVSGFPALTGPPLQVWTENADGSGAVNFLTGMGGFLQAALFGFTGFR